MRGGTEELSILYLEMACATKVSAGKGGAVLEDVPHLTDWLPNLRVSIRGLWDTMGSTLVLLGAFFPLNCLVLICNDRVFRLWLWILGGLL